VVPEVLVGAAFGSVVVLVVPVLLVPDVLVPLLVWANVQPASSIEKSVNRASFRMRDAPSGFLPQVP
jgi:uncharacterized membrane protein